MGQCSHDLYESKVDFDNPPHIAFTRIHGDSTLVTVETDASGQKTVTGNAKKLKESAHYPVQFGLEISKMIQPKGSPDPNPDRVFNTVQLCFFIDWSFEYVRFVFNEWYPLI